TAPPVTSPLSLHDALPISTHTTSYSLTVNGPSGGGITNGGFETGSLSGWTSAGTTSVVSTGAHGGTYAARAGSTSPTNGDSSIKLGRAHVRTPVTRGLRMT